MKENLTSLFQQSVDQTKSWFKAHPRHLRAITMVLMTIICLMIFEEVSDDIFSDPKEGDFEAVTFDHQVINYFKSWRTVRLNQIINDITALGSLSVIGLLTFIMIGLLIAYKDAKGLLYLIIMSLGTITLPWILKALFERPRPSVLEHLARVETHSFPSGHAFAASVMYLSLAYLASRRLDTLKVEILYYLLATLVIALVGLSRIYLGVHYPTDIVAGISSGIAWFLLVTLVMQAKAK